MEGMMEEQDPKLKILEEIKALMDDRIGAKLKPKAVSVEKVEVSPKSPEEEGEMEMSVGGPEEDGAEVMGGLSPEEMDMLKQIRSKLME